MNENIQRILDRSDRIEKGHSAVYRDLGPSAPLELIVDVAVARGAVSRPADEDERAHLCHVADCIVGQQLTRTFGRIPAYVLLRLILFTHEEGPPILRTGTELGRNTRRGVGLREETLQFAIRVLSGESVPGERCLPPVIEHHYTPATDTHTFMVYFDVLAQVLDQERV